MKIKFEGVGEYGIREGFFNFIVEIDGIEYDVQCCANNDDTIDFNDCGYDWGLCADINVEIFGVLGHESTLELIKQAYKLHCS
jgi:hypothetical protein